MAHKIPFPAFSLQSRDFGYLDPGPPLRAAGEPERMAGMKMVGMNKRRGFAVETVVWVIAVAFGYYSRHTHDWGVVAFFLMFAAICTTVYRRALNSD